MKKVRNSKIIAILALCVSVVGLTLGFAAFSNTLTISSSATVSPDASDFKLVLYGLPQRYFGDYDIDSEIFRNVNAYTSTSHAGAFGLNGVGDFEYATIDNDNLTLSNIKATFKEPNDGVNYIMVLKNEGKYDAYIDVSEFVFPNHVCIPDEGTTPEYVDEICPDILFNINIGHYDNATGRIDWDITKYFDENGNILIPMNSHVYISVVMVYDYIQGQARADGGFSVKWEDAKINFSTVSQ